MDTNDTKTVDTPRGNEPAADIAPATDFSPSGAPRQITEFDAEHPAIDNNPRANTTARQNQADFNDPTISGAEAVAKNLGMTTEGDVAKGVTYHPAEAPAPVPLAPAPAAKV